MTMRGYGRARIGLELDAFYFVHRRCGEPSSEVTEVDRGWVVIASTCRAKIARRISAQSS